MERPGRSLAWIFAVATTGLLVGGLTILLLTLDYPPRGGWGFRGFPSIFALGAGAIGWLIMLRRPDNRIGIVLALIGLLNASQLFLTEYAALGARTSLPASNLAGWVNAFIWVPTLALMGGGVPLIFPDGRLPTPRWRSVAFLLVGATAALVAIIAIYPDALSTPRFVRRVIILPVPDDTWNRLSYVATVVLGAAVTACAASLILRWRRASGVVREQLKWLALSVALIVATMALSIIPNPLLNAVFILAIGTVPVAIGVAVLRYRLYEIDAVISRTLVFGALTAILAGLFAGLQKLFQTIFVGVTGNESDAALVITTLILAAAFAPLKTALEKAVQRRVGPGAPALAVASADPAGGSTPVAAVVPTELEALLRRVVREELRAARSGVAEETPGA